MNSIHERVDRIRREPEHVRVRYVWAMVAVVMTMIVLLWVVTLRDSLRKSIPADADTLRKSAAPTVFGDTEEDSASRSAAKPYLGEGIGTGATR
ncbi:MAG: hypothetical protein HGB18_03125 [Candidatus Moranbacteria bacterium]|nr:hypothetical protein [Candidatus Moranbacteria bacterium]